jgi:hypothetical protein
MDPSNTLSTWPEPVEVRPTRFLASYFQHRRKYGGPRLSTDRHDPCKPLPGLGAEEKYIRILHDFLRNVVSELARSRVIVNYRKNHKMKPFVHVADWCWC